MMPKILIIEDERDIAEIERDYLDVNGFECDIATTGEEGLKLAKQNTYSLILLDLMLPGRDGFEICRELREFLSIPILMVTARKEDIDKIRGFDRGADDYIVKPFTPSELVARVKAHIARYTRLIKQGQEKEELVADHVVVDLASRRVFVEEVEKTFTAKEFDLLVFLMKHPDRVFSKEHLFERIWGYDAFGDSTTVTVHIRKIREKIEKQPSEPKMIETVWGVGYRFRNRTI